MDESLRDRLLQLDTPTLSDALDTLGLPGAVIGIGPLTVRRRIAGSLRTVKLGAPLPNLPKRHLGAGAIMGAEKGQIIVVEHRGRLDVSGWWTAVARGIDQRHCWVLVDGAVRDVDEAEEIGFPVFARAAVPVTARGRVAEHAHDEPITFAGLAVKPGDWVLADRSGIVFIPAAGMEEILTVAERIFAREQLMARDIESGRPIGDVMGADYEDMLKG